MYIPVFIKTMILYQFQSIIQNIIQQASYLQSILDQNTSQYSSSLWFSINLRALSSLEFNKTFIFYQIQSNILKDVYTLFWKNPTHFLIHSIQTMKPYILHIIKNLNKNSLLIPQLSIWRIFNNNEIKWVNNNKNNCSSWENNITKNNTKYRLTNNKNSWFIP